MSGKTRAGIFGCALVEILMMLGVVFWNKFPLMFWDVQWYVCYMRGGCNDGQKAFGYSWFMKLCGADYTLLFIPVFQALITFFVLHILFRYFSIHRRYLIRTGVVACLCILSTLSYEVSFLMPDFITALMIIALFMLLYPSETLNTYEKVFLVFILILGCISHSSNFPLAICVAFVVFLRDLLKKLPFIDIVKKNAIVFSSLAASLLVILGVNYRNSGIISLSRTGHIYLLARLIEDKSIQRLLDSRCKEKAYLFCDDRDRLESERLTFLFHRPEILEKYGGWTTKNQEPFKEMILDSFRYDFFYNIKVATQQFLAQLITFNFSNVEILIKQDELAYKSLAKYYPQEMKMFLDSRQETETIGLWDHRFNYLQFLFTVLCVLLVLTSFVFTKKVIFPLIELRFIIIATLIMNAFLMSFFSHSDYRYQARVIWLISLLAIFILLDKLGRWQKLTNSKE
jgi:hypothetical protein